MKLALVAGAPGAGLPTVPRATCRCVRGADEAEAEQDNERAKERTREQLSNPAIPVCGHRSLLPASVPPMASSRFA
jgi:hypothetical protein